MASRLPKPFTTSELRAIFTHAAPDIHAVSHFLLETGLRAHEFASISSAEVRDWPRFGRVSIRVIGKGSKERMVPLTRKAKRAGRRLVRYSQNGLLAPYSERGLRWKFEELSRLTGVHVHAHRFRHTAASRWANKRHADAYVIADLLGHSNLNTTKGYTRLSSRRLRRGM